MTIRVKKMKRRNVLQLGTTALFSSWIINFSAQAETELNSTPTIESVISSADGIPIGYLKTGTGPSLVIVHGALGTGDEWLPVASELAQHFTCYLMDRRGRGRSGDSEEYSLEKEVEDIKAVLDVAGPDAFLLGHSYGAICAIETANKYPVPKLILYEPPLPINGSVVGPAFKDFKRAVEENQLEEALVIMLTKLVNVSDDQLKGLQQSPFWNDMVALSPTVVRELQVIEELEHGVERFFKSSSPTLLLMGTDTAPHHITAIRALENTLPNNQTFEFSGQGHDAHLVITAEFSNEVMDFLQAEH